MSNCRVAWKKISVRVFCRVSESSQKWNFNIRLCNISLFESSSYEKKKNDTHIERNF